MSHLLELDALNAGITSLIYQRDKLLRLIRSECKHLHLVELDAGPPKRICVECGAEERGWYCGYHVLVMNGDPYEVPYKNERVLVKRTTDDVFFYSHRQSGPLYLVGQSHPNFAGGGLKSYEQLTEVAD